MVEDYMNYKQSLFGKYSPLRKTFRNRLLKYFRRGVLTTRTKKCYIRGFQVIFRLLSIKWK